jgi:hypothetical protein
MAKPRNGEALLDLQGRPSGVIFFTGHPFLSSQRIRVSISNDGTVVKGTPGLILAI